LSFWRFTNRSLCTLWSGFKALLIFCRCRLHKYVTNTINCISTQESVLICPPIFTILCLREFVICWFQESSLMLVWEIIYVTLLCWSWYTASLEWRYYWLRWKLMMLLKHSLNNNYPTHSQYVVQSSLQALSNCIAIFHKIKIVNECPAGVYHSHVVL